MPASDWLLRELKESGHENDTLVIYLSDNGRPLPGAKDNLTTKASICR